MNNRQFFTLFLLILFTFNIGASNLDPTFDEKVFDKTSWIKGNLRDRGEMVENLIAQQKILIGLNKNEVIYLLGSPDKKLKNVYHYYVDLGIEENGKLIIFTMIIFLSENQQVVELVKLKSL